MKDYLIQFNAVTMKIQDLNPAMELCAIQCKIQSRPFAYLLAINLARTTTKFRERAIGYINMEEMGEVKGKEAWKSIAKPNGNDLRQI